MKNSIDETILSSYLDGELEPEQTNELAQKLERDETARDTLLAMLRVHSLLKANARSLEKNYEKSNVVDFPTGGQTNQSSFGKRLSPLLAAAVLIMTLSVGFVLGLQNGTQAPVPLESNLITHSHFFSSHPLIQNSLENDKSGTTRHWQDKDSTASLEVTPIKTYQNADGVFHRLYTVNISRGNQREQATCMAYRDTEKKWKTQSIRFHETIRNI